jgi:hypothetical protein
MMLVKNQKLDDVNDRLFDNGQNSSLRIFLPSGLSLVFASGLPRMPEIGESRKDPNQMAPTEAAAYFMKSLLLIPSCKVLVLLLIPQIISQTHDKGKYRKDYMQNNARGRQKSNAVNILYKFIISLM